MLRAVKTAISLEPEEIIELERIIIDGEEKDALEFLKKKIYRRVQQSQIGDCCRNSEGCGCC